MSDPHAEFVARTGFIVELARALHTYGTTAPRLEAAIDQVARRLGVRSEVWSNPTGIIVSFGGPGTEGGPESTRVLRLPPGEVDLGKLCAADAIAEKVLAGDLDLAAGRVALRALDRPPARGAQWRIALSFGLASAAVAGLLRAAWVDVLAAGLIGVTIGVLSVFGARRPRLAEASDALAALLATLLAAAAATFLVPLALKPVLVAALIVLLPGMMLTNAAAELTSQHLVSGSARFAGALTVLAKLTFGTVAANQLVRVLGWRPVEAIAGLAPAWQEGLWLLVGSFAFAVLFRAERRDYPLAMAAAALGYAITRLTGAWLGTAAGDFPAGVFLAGMSVIALSNVYARWKNRPGAVVRLPGIILLVPGSIGFRSLNLMFEREVMLGLDSALSLLAVLAALVAGLLFGNLIVPARRSL